MLREVERRRERWLRDRAAAEKGKKQKPAAAAAAAPARGDAAKTPPAATRKRSRVVPAAALGNGPGIPPATAAPGSLSSTISSSSSNNNNASNIGADHLQTYLSAQLMSHSCPICFELMRGEARAPVLVFGCGHSFCKGCLQRYCLDGSATELKPCPVCNEAIQSWAVNKSLQTMIESFLQSRAHHLEQRRPESSTPTGQVRETGPANTGDGSAEYFDKLSALETRIQILANQRAGADASQKTAAQKRHAFERAQASLASEERAAQDAVQAAQAQLDLVRQHLRDQEAKTVEAARQEHEAANKMRMIESSLADLRLERDKVALLLQAAKRGPGSSRGSA